jgi:hypothetical protein
VAEKKPILIEIDDAKLDETLEILNQLPQKGRSLRDVIAYVVEGLNRALTQGYSYKELSEVLAEQRISIAESTLKQYVTEINKVKRSKSARRKPASQSTIASPSPVKVQETAEDKPSSSTQTISRPVKKSESSTGKFVEMPNEL